MYLRGDEIRKIILLSTTNGKADGKGEYLIPLLPVMGGYAGNQGKGDCYLLYNNKKHHIEIKVSQSLSPSSAPIVINTKMQNPNLNKDISKYMDALLNVIKSIYPILDEHLSDFYSKTFMIMPNMQFYRESTFKKDSQYKVFTYDDFFKKIGALKEHLPVEIHQEYINKINNIVISAAYDFEIELFPSQSAKNNIELMQQISNHAAEYINKEYSCEKNNGIWKNTIINKSYKRGYDLFGQYNTSKCWHEFGSYFCHDYMKNEENSSIIFMYVPTDNEVDNDDLITTLSPDIDSLKMYNDKVSFIMPDTWGKKADQRCAIRIVFREGY